MSFGYKTAWFAVRSADPQAVLRALDLRNAAPAPAEVGILAGYGGGGGMFSRQAFVTPPLQGWILATSTGFLGLSDGPSSPFIERIARLSAELGTEVQYFATHRVVEAHTWARARDGKTVRAYSYVGDGGTKEVDLGDPTPEERELGFAFFDPSSPEAQQEGYWEREDLRSPDEEDVMSVAGRRSVNPTLLADLADGLLADLPAPPAPVIEPAVEPPAEKRPWWRFW